MVATNENASRTEIAVLLELVCMSVQLTKTQHESAEKHYHSVGDWLAADDSPLAVYLPEIYPQGSMALETTVRPRLSLEFDLDLVCLLFHPAGANADPQELFRKVRERISSHGVLGGLLVAHDKCIRLRYANDFHLDVIPAIPNPDIGPTGIYIPINGGQKWSWKPNDPKRFANWFREEAVVKYAERSFAASVESLPERRPALAKEPLRRAVQLFKRYRDVRYGDNSEAPSSIILTTLSGNHYMDGRNCYEALLTILIGIRQAMEQSSGILPIPNPINVNENFTAGWTQKRYDRFRSFVNSFIEDLYKLHQCEGLDAIGKKLSEMFDVQGQTAVTAALQEYEHRFTVARTSGNLGVTATAALTTAAVPKIVVPRNTYYGQTR